MRVMSEILFGYFVAVVKKKRFTHREKKKTRIKVSKPFNPPPPPKKKKQHLKLSLNDEPYLHANHYLCCVYRHEHVLLPMHTQSSLHPPPSPHTHTHTSCPSWCVLPGRPLLAVISFSFILSIHRVAHCWFFLSFTWNAFTLPPRPE